MKKPAAFTIALLMFFTLSAPAVAANEAVRLSGTQVNNTESVWRVEETVWYFRTYNGQPQRRLWSITYAYWKTDWIPV